MAQAVTVFRHDDTGAPQLSADRKPSEILAILQACLVDGYGTKTALGWTKEFEDAASFKVAYRNNVTAGGTGGYVQFWSIDGTDGNGKLVNARSALGMTGIDVFVKPSHKTATQATNAGWTGWTLIGTPTAFYFIITNPAGPMGKRRNINENVIFCGDIKPYIPNDASAFIATGTPIQNGDFTPTALGSYNNIFATLWRTQRSFAATQPLLMYGADGTDTGVGYGFITGYHGFDEYTRNRTGQRKGLYNPIVIGAFNTYPYSVLLDPEGVLYSDSVKWPTYRGELPGLVTETFAHIENATWPLIESHFGKDHWAICSTGLTLNVWINMEEWS